LLELLYSEVRASVPLMIVARTAAIELAATGDSVANALIGWLDRHISDEIDHDAWLLGDYARTGADSERLAASPGTPTVAAMVGSVYYWSLHAHPVAILGYCAVLEGTPPTRRLIDRLMERTGYPIDAFDTLRHHSDVDNNHSRHLFELIDGLPLTQGEEAIIGMTALQTADLLVAAGDELLSSLSRASEPATSAAANRLRLHPTRRKIRQPVPTDARP
jgi:predicted nucleotidyltransferase